MKLQDITNAACKERLSNLLREQIGAGKRFTVDAAAGQLDIDGRALRAYLDGENLPPMPVLLKMMKLFGPAFANRLLRIADLDGAFCQEAEAVTDLELNGDVSKMMGDLGAALRFGKVNHRDRIRVNADARELQAILDNYLAMHDGMQGESAAGPAKHPVSGRRCDA